MKQTAFLCMIRAVLLVLLLVFLVSSSSGTMSPSVLVFAQSNVVDTDDTTNEDGETEASTSDGGTSDDGNQIFLPVINLSTQNFSEPSAEAELDVGLDGETVDTKLPGTTLPDSDSTDTASGLDETEPTLEEDSEDEESSAEPEVAERASTIAVNATNDDSGTPLYSLSDGMTASGTILPSITNFTSDLFTGAASVNIPIEAPSGLGGMNPNISLSYSSESVNAIRRSAAGAHEIQAGLAGYGWSIGGLSYIVDGKNQKTLVLNGTSVRIDEDGNTSPHIFAKVERDLLVSTEDDHKKVWNAGEWIVTTTDGTKYYFGVPNDANLLSDMLDWENRALTLPVETLIDYETQTVPGSKTYRNKVVKYLLRKVVDPLGNRMEYEYKAEIFPVSGGRCNVSGTEDRYRRSTRPTKISWSANELVDGPTIPQIEMIFGYEENRTDIDSEWEEVNCNQALFHRHRLSDITVQVKDASPSPHILSTYVLAHTYSADSGTKKHLVLESVSKYGKEGAGVDLDGDGIDDAPLTTQSFTYTETRSNFNILLLESAEHSWGGKTTYEYKDYNNITSCIGDSDNNWGPCDETENRTVVSNIYVSDGVLNGNVTRTRYDYYGGLERRGSNGIESLGHHKVKTWVYDRSENIVKHEVSWFYQNDFFRESTEAPDYNKSVKAIKDPNPALGKPRKVTIYQPTSLATVGGSSDCGGRAKITEENVVYCEMSRTDYVWKAKTNGGSSWNTDATYDTHPRWVHLKETVSTVDSATNRQILEYEIGRQGGKQFGNVTLVEDWADGTKLKKTETEFYPNEGNNIVNKPAQVKVYDAGGTCLALSRTLYDTEGARLNFADATNHTDYTTPPLKGLAVKAQVNIGAINMGGDCPAANLIGNADVNWSISQTNYDGYGNPVRQITYGDNESAKIDTTITYDDVYHLFPTQYRDTASGIFVETLKHYGVTGNSPFAISDGRAYWGQMAEFCGVNGICTRQSYDAHGRALHRWENVKKNDGWRSDGSSTVEYVYKNPDTINGNKAYIVTEWRAPRSDGNFTRSHYNGLGQLVMVQSPHQKWAGCSGSKCEIATYYGYDALGNQNRASVPLLISKSLNDIGHNGIGSDSWWVDHEHSLTTYDALGRLLVNTAPNGDESRYKYTKRETEVTRAGKVLSWQKTDGFGHLAETRTYSGVGGSMMATIYLAHSAVGNLTSVKDGSTELSRMTYDMGGRKKTMTDEDLGNWTYAYNRLGNLIRQTDGRGKVTCLYYDGYNRMEGKKFADSGTCQTDVTPYDVAFAYDGGGGANLGQLTIARNSAYQKTLSYNDIGLLESESVFIAGAPQTYNTSYSYDSHHRLQSTSYPDGDVLTLTYNGMGLPETLHSSFVDGLLVDQALYNEAGLLRQMKLPKGNLWRTNVYYGWGENNRRLQEIRVGNSQNSSEKILLTYTYDSQANIASLNETYSESDYFQSHSFTYDAQNRLTGAFGELFTYAPDGQFTKFRSVDRSSPPSDTPFPHHAYKHSGYNYDANGNMTKRATPQGEQTLTWDYENRLERVEGAGTNEEYWYDVDGIRIKKQNNISGEVIFYVSPLFEVSMSIEQATAASNQSTANAAQGQ